MANVIEVPNFNLKPYSLSLNKGSENSVSVEKMIWRVNIGDEVRFGDVLCEIDCSSFLFELESICEGFVLYINQRKRMKPGDSLVVIGTREEQFDESYRNKIRESYGLDTTDIIDNVVHKRRKKDNGYLCKALLKWFNS